MPAEAVRARRARARAPAGVSYALSVIVCARRKMPPVKKTPPKKPEPPPKRRKKAVSRYPLSSGTRGSLDLVKHPKFSRVSKDKIAVYVIESGRFRGQVCARPTRVHGIVPGRSKL